MEKLYGVRFRIPKYSEFCTAIGAALDYKMCIRDRHHFVYDAEYLIKDILA